MIKENISLRNLGFAKKENVFGKVFQISVQNASIPKKSILLNTSILFQPLKRSLRF